MNGSLKDADSEQPILQILGSKKINNNSVNTDKERYRMLLSDGICSISHAMLATQANDDLPPGGPTNFTVIKVKKFVTSMINGGKADAT